ncbi:MAG: hypothetical protein DWQ37_16255 [Planctomycetota bacterium]|nr:MAG: hypothetical protein DWQ37_16255 [Planctomycetota bacterium]
MDDKASRAALPTLTIAGSWNWRSILEGESRPLLASAMAEAILKRRWFGAKTRTIKSLEIVDAVGMTPSVWLLVAKLEFTSGQHEVYHVPLAFAPADGAAPTTPWITVVDNDAQPVGTLCDAMDDVGYCRRLLELFDEPQALSGKHGQLLISQTSAYGQLRGGASEVLEPKPVRAEQSNSSVIYGQRLILKAFRRVEMGMNPDFEISEFLTRCRFPHSPLLAGALTYQQEGQEPWALAMLQAFVPNQGDAWSFTLDWLAGALRGADRDAPPAPLPSEGILRASESSIPAIARSTYEGFLGSAALLGKRTAEMHLALASDTGDPDFAPEPFGDEDRRDAAARMSQEARATFELLRQHAPRLEGDVRASAERLLGREAAALERFGHFDAAELKVDKIRCHGDYHLGQVLASDGDFVIIDYEGEPVRSISERRKKQLAARDVAGMVRSLHYASCSASSVVPADQVALTPAQLDAWTRAWYAWSAVSFLSAYHDTVGKASFLPDSMDAFERAVGVCLLEKALYELRYELNNRPDWVYLPLAALIDLLGNDA